MKVVVLNLMVVLLAGGTAHASLITNGSFESPDVATGLPGASGPNPAIPGWTLIPADDDIRVFDGEFFISGGNVAQAGDQYLGMGTFEAPVGGIISQSFATAIGLTYQVSFWANNASFQTTVHKWDVSVDTTTPTTLAAEPSLSNEWQQFGFSFVATGTTSTLSFQSAIVSGGDGTSADILLDNVSVVPEPATAGLITVGMLGILRTRRRTAA